MPHTIAGTVMEGRLKGQQCRDSCEVSVCTVNTVLLYSLKKFHRTNVDANIKTSIHIV